MAPPYPNFVIIGAARAGGRWLRFNLDRHPDVYAPPHPIDFFCDRARFDGGSRWYREQFESWDGATAVGECSPSYMDWRNQPRITAARMAGLLPDACAIALLRDPIDRLASEVRVRQRLGELPPGDDLGAVSEAVFAQLGVEGLGTELMRHLAFAPSLTAYSEAFGDRLLVLFYEDLCADPHGLYRRVLGHLGIDEDFVPDDLDRVRFRGPRHEGAPATPTPELRADVIEFVRTDVEAVEELTGRDLSAWTSTEPAVQAAGG